MMPAMLIAFAAFAADPPAGASKLIKESAKKVITDKAGDAISDALPKIAAGGRGKQVLKETFGFDDATAGTIIDLVDKKLDEARDELIDAVVDSTLGDGLDKAFDLIERFLQRAGGRPARAWKKPRAAQVMAITPGKFKLNGSAVEWPAFCSAEKDRGPSRADSFSPIDDDGTEVVRHDGDGKETATLGKAVQKKWLEVRGADTTLALWIVPLDKATYVITVKNATFLSIGGAAARVVRGKDVKAILAETTRQRSRLAEEADRMIRKHEVVAADREKTLKLLLSNFDVSCQVAVWATQRDGKIYAPKMKEVVEAVADRLLLRLGVALKAFKAKKGIMEGSD
jgi:hypothetical protein